MRKRVERNSGTHCVSGVNPSMGRWGASNRNYFSQNTHFSILQLFEPLFFKFFSLFDLKHNLPHTAQSLIFVHLQNGFFFSFKINFPLFFLFFILNIY